MAKLTLSLLENYLKNLFSQKSHDGLDKHLGLSEKLLMHPLMDANSSLSNLDNCLEPCHLFSQDPKTTKLLHYIT